MSVCPTKSNCPRGPIALILSARALRRFCPRRANVRCSQTADILAPTDNRSHSDGLCFQRLPLRLTARRIEATTVSPNACSDLCMFRGATPKSRLFNTPLENTPDPASCATPRLKRKFPNPYPNFLFLAMRGTPSFPPVTSARRVGALLPNGPDVAPRGLTSRRRQLGPHASPGAAHGPR